MTIGTTPTDERLSRDELRSLFLFEALSDAQLDVLATHGWVNDCPAGDTILDEGKPAELVILLLNGTLTLNRRVGPDDVEMTRTDQRGVYFGAMQSYLEDGDKLTYTATAHALTDCRLFVLRAGDFGDAVRTWFPMAIHLLEGLFYGMRNSQNVIGQRQQLLALGSLAAGLTHELNNPAAAAVRANAGLRQGVQHMRQKLGMIAHDKIDERLLAALVEVQEEAVQLVASAPELPTLQESEREDELTGWLEEHGVTDAWSIAPVFVGAGTTTEFLDRVMSSTPDDLQANVLRWLASTLETELLLNEIDDSVTRISTLVSAAKQYSHMDRAPFERADIHAGLKSTLTILAGKLADVEVVKEFDRSLPPVPIYGGELNQVWTNLIDNAVQAMAGQPGARLTLRSALDGDMVRVEICDNGPGIPAENKQRIFEPFFTTKPVGQGTGLGLDISYRIVVARHGGDLRVESEPGRTCFVVRLPLTERPNG
jgi:signal transduction histidine kinase